MALYNAETVNPVQFGHNNYLFNLVNPTPDMPLYQQLQAWSVQAGHGVPRWDVPSEASKVERKQLWIATPILVGVRYARYTKNGHTINEAKADAARFMIQDIILNDLAAYLRVGWALRKQWGRLCVVHASLKTGYVPRLIDTIS